jgi:hypothetical protein
MSRGKRERIAVLYEGEYRYFETWAAAERWAAAVPGSVVCY